MGDGIAASGAQAELTRVADLVGAVVWGGNCSEVNMRASHPLFGGYLGHMFGEDSLPIISAADVVLICGTTVLPEVFPALDGVFAADAKVIHFDLNTTEIAKNFPLDHRRAGGAEGDARRPRRGSARNHDRGGECARRRAAQAARSGQDGAPPRRVG